MSAVGVNSSMRPEMVGLGNNLVKARPRLATIQLQESPGSQGYALVPISAGILRVGYPFNAKNRPNHPRHMVQRVDTFVQAKLHVGRGVLHDAIHVLAGHVDNLGAGTPATDERGF